MANYINKSETPDAEQVVAWSVDFISTRLDSFDLTERWKMAADACKYLQLQDISSRETGLNYVIQRIDLQKLQKQLHSAFDSYLMPFITGKDVISIVLPSSRSWPPKAFTLADGELRCTRVLIENLEKVGVANFLDSVQSLTPLSIDRFRKCEGCNRWFFPTGKRTRKERRYCSRACNLRDTARRQRERNKERNIKRKLGIRTIRIKNKPHKKEENYDGNNS